ncbi:hypothetical protein CK203_106324 [Vitis vinifera]|uniref:Reverse transcriptase Ty1/copia-type domain-containing protein n=1 Tax=Vitis vinifera TaxID=29760 RepID=A0A438CDT3_VITVI|nr:hypothetical protein CK203_106324 [Vitis vinifera]
MGNCAKTKGENVNAFPGSLSLAVNLKWLLQQLDVKNVFLNGDLEEEVYMDLPSGSDKEMKDGKDDRLGTLLETSSEYNLVWRRKGEATVDLRNGRLRICWAVLFRVGNRFKSLEAMARVFRGGEGMLLNRVLSAKS